MGSLEMTANHFGVANCTASKVIFEVCCAIYSVLGSSLSPPSLWSGGNENES